MIPISILLLSCTGPDVSNTETWESPTNFTTTASTTGLPCEKVDLDGDGANSCDDCDDAVWYTYPGADERCDGEDNDCDGELHPEEEVDLNGDGEPDCSSCDDGGYWAQTRELTGNKLWSKLNTLSDEVQCRYSDATDEMFIYLDNVDHLVTGVYTGIEVKVVDEKPDEIIMNTEHTWPQSKGASKEPAKCDLHHLFPTDATANTTRSSYRFGNVVGSIDWSEGGSALGNSDDGETVFEPRDDHKGNVARAMVYFAVRYEYSLSASDLALYNEWNIIDPIDDTELSRTLSIKSFQGNANPFVTCPDFINLIVE